MECQYCGDFATKLTTCCLIDVCIDCNSDLETNPCIYCHLFPSISSDIASNFEVTTITLPNQIINELSTNYLRRVQSLKDIILTHLNNINLLKTASEKTKVTIDTHYTRDYPDKTNHSLAIKQWELHDENLKTLKSQLEIHITTLDKISVLTGQTLFNTLVTLVTIENYNSSFNPPKTPYPYIVNNNKILIPDSQTFTKVKVHTDAFHQVEASSKFTINYCCYVTFENNQIRCDKRGRRSVERIITGTDIIPKGIFEEISNAFILRALDIIKIDQDTYMMVDLIDENDNYLGRSLFGEIVDNKLVKFELIKSDCSVYVIYQELAVFRDGHLILVNIKDRTERSLPIPEFSHDMMFYVGCNFDVISLYTYNKQNTENGRYYFYHRKDLSLLTFCDCNDNLECYLILPYLITYDTKSRILTWKLNDQVVNTEKITDWKLDFETRSYNFSDGIIFIE